ncbi:protein kinase [Chitinimonas arctica]|uniref:non-specific serine/threonine protein kinase n=1 Tax=Chitinimonas arctica TaxID=2594795 RepID=A0A516SCB0_9NEIS|nr:serine/threonine-protein kinase [Chitinimonas arctica]QDQ25784.1 protein kinase [Chitinimonas arctica]
MDILGHYRIHALLGQGAMGVVYRAVDERLERTVALKVLRLNLSAEERAEYAPRLQQEAKSAARLNHPNIITVYDCGDIDGHAFLAIEFVEGKTLQSLMESGIKISCGRVVKLAGQLFGALAYAHEHEVVHRDIKPANLMLTADGRLKITDFGIAQLPASDLTRAGTLVGSPRYMAPEQIEGKKLDGRADIFAAGIVLYEVLTGTRPFDGEHVATIAYRILHETPSDIRSLNPDVPEWLAELVMRCLEKDPAKRFQSAREARSALREQATTGSNGHGHAAAPAEPVEAQARTAVAPDGKMAATLQRYAPWLLTGGLALLGGIAALIWVGSRSKPEVKLITNPPAAVALQPEVMEPPGAPGSLPKVVAAPAPVQEAPLPVETPPAVVGTDGTGTVVPPPTGAGDATATQKKPVAKPKPKPLETIAPSDGSRSVIVEHREKAVVEKRPDSKQDRKDDKDERGLLERLAGCSADGTCPKSKRATRDR